MESAEKSQDIMFFKYLKGYVELYMKMRLLGNKKQQTEAGENLAKY
jgi:hypothetical protein